MHAGMADHRMNTSAPGGGSVAGKAEPRYLELDSLRGVAALTVVFYHFRLLWFGYDFGAKWWQALCIPFSDGHEAVMLFFLLSGFVLSIPLLRGKGQPYPAYLLRRLLRIYAPYLFALFLAVGGAARWHGSLGMGPWADMTWFRPLSSREVLQHVLMLGNYNWAEYNTAFWSIVIELRISIIFPLLFLMVRRSRAVTSLLVSFCACYLAAKASIHWPESEQTLVTIQSAAVFVCGILLAIHIERVCAWYRALGRSARSLFALSAFLLYSFGYRFSYRFHHHLTADQWLITLGSAGYILLALNAPVVRRVLVRPAFRFLGRVSYSLYLVHGTVLFALAHAFGRRLTIPEHLLLAVSLSVVVAYGFCVGVEEPFLRLSRRVGRRVTAAEQGRTA